MSKSVRKRPFAPWKILLLCLLAGTAALVLPVSADKPVVMIVAHGAGSYYLGEEVVLSGMNTDTGYTYLYITGPNLPESGGKLTSPDQKAVSGNADTFTVANTTAGNTWTYSWFTAGLALDAGTYTIYAVSEPKTGDQLADAPYGTTSIIIKKPFVSAGISPSPVQKGQPFTVSGTAVMDKNQSSVRIWIFGNNYVFTTTTPVNSDASFTFNANTTISGKLPAGQNYLVVQHPMLDNQFDIVVSGDYIRNTKLNNGTNLFKITGPGSLQGGDAVEALITAISDQAVRDDTLTNDTYTLIPFHVTEAGSASATDSEITISADGIQSYYLGEKVVFRGRNTGSNSTYLFITGPGLPAAGVELASPNNEAVGGDPKSFTVVKTNPDTSWEYTYYTANLPFPAGTYTVYATDQPKTADQLGSDAANVSIILKKPFITAALSSSSVSKGQPFRVTGTAVGNPSMVQIWIIGDNYVFTTKTPLNSDNTTFTFNADATLSGKLPAGQNYLFVQHPMANNQFDIDVSGEYVRNLKLNNGTNLFKITGSGSLQGSDAADALIAAFCNTDARDDTYAVIPFQVTGTGSLTSQSAGATTAPVQREAQQFQFLYIPVGGLLLVLGIVLWKRH